MRNNAAITVVSSSEAINVVSSSEAINVVARKKAIAVSLGAVNSAIVERRGILPGRDGARNHPRKDVAKVAGSYRE